MEETYGVCNTSLITAKKNINRQKKLNKCTECRTFVDKIVNMLLNCWLENKLSMEFTSTGQVKLIHVKMLSLFKLSRRVNTVNLVRAGGCITFSGHWPFINKAALKNNTPLFSQT